VKRCSSEGRLGLTQNGIEAMMQRTEALGMIAQLQGTRTNTLNGLNGVHNSEDRDDRGLGTKNMPAPDAADADDNSSF